MSQFQAPNEFRGSLRVISADETVNAHLASMVIGTTASDTTITINADALLCIVKGFCKADVAVSGTATLKAADSGKVFLQTASSGSQTFTLPKATVGVGLTYTFVCMNAGGEILLTPNAADQIQVKASEGGASVFPAAGTGVKNTAATNVVGDSITIVSDGIATWVAIQQSGTWASQ